MKGSVSRRKPKNVASGPNGKVPPTALELRFAKAQSKLNPRRAQLVRAIFDSADETYFLSSRELAKRYNVDASTIVRATQVMKRSLKSSVIVRPQSYRTSAVLGPMLPTNPGR